jgi:cysteine desulfurase/selenocysteine lyase
MSQPGSVPPCPIPRVDFPGLLKEVKGKRLAYLDNAATTQRPLAVLREMDDLYETDNANVHRGVHTLSQRATERFEAARVKVARKIHAQSAKEIIFTKGCTESINLVAAAWGRTFLRPGQVILASTMEHHANLVPWQMIAEEKGAKVVPIPISDSGELDLAALEKQLKDLPVVLIAVKHVCNTLGTINPIAEIARLARENGVLTMIDGAQGLAHEEVNVTAWGIDFYAMASHKTYGPFGVGALWGRKELLEQMPPYQGGGDMIRKVSFEGTTFNTHPNKFEAGTPNVAGVVGFGAALDLLDSVGLEKIQAHEKALLRHAEARLKEVPGLRIYGEAARKAGIISFTIDGIHPHDLGTILDTHGVAIRTGHHCCMPLMQRLGLPATARVSLAVYNGIEDIDVLIDGLAHARSILA